MIVVVTPDYLEAYENLVMAERNLIVAASVARSLGITEGQLAKARDLIDTAAKR